MEANQIASATDYFECALDPNEFRPIKDQELSRASQILAGVQEAPMKVWSLLLTVLYFVISPLTSSEALTSCRRNGKKIKRNFTKSYR